MAVLLRTDTCSANVFWRLVRTKSTSKGELRRIRRDAPRLSDRASRHALIRNANDHRRLRWHTVKVVDREAMHSYELLGQEKVTIQTRAQHCTGKARDVDHHGVRIGGPGEVRKELPPYSGDVRGGCVRAAARRQVVVNSECVVHVVVAVIGVIPVELVGYGVTSRRYMRRTAW